MSATLDDVLAKSRALLAAVDFDNNGNMVGMARMGGNGGLLSLDTTKAADALRLAFDKLGEIPSANWRAIATADRSLTARMEFPGIPAASYSHPIWCRTNNGTPYEASWVKTDAGNEYWWAWDLEDVVEPDEWMPHQLDTGAREVSA